MTPKLGLWPAHRHTHAHACTYMNVHSHVYTCVYTYHTRTNSAACGGGSTVKIKRNVDPVTIPGVDNGREHAASAKKMDRTLFTGKQTLYEQKLLNGGFCRTSFLGRW